MFQVWYCTSSRSHTTVAKYAEYIATSFKEAKERLGDKFTINPTVSKYQHFYKILTTSLTEKMTTEERCNRQVVLTLLLHL